MKIWMKLLLGTILGFILSLFLPLDSASWQSSLILLSEIVLRLGRYIAFPLFFFTMATGIYELQREKQLMTVLLRIIIFTAGGTLLLVLLGTVVTAFFTTPRIPIVVESYIPPDLPDMTSIVRSVFPYNMFKVFSGKAHLLLPLYFLAFLLGLNFSFDKTLAAPAQQFFHSMGLVFYHVNTLFLEILGVGMVFLSISFLIQLQSIIDPGMFSSLYILIALLTVLILGGLFPFILYLLDPDKDNPYKLLYGNLGALLTAFFSGDLYFSSAALIKHSQENHGIPRRISSVFIPFASMFSKAGTAMISALSMVIILQSYSSLEITLFQIFWIIFFAFLVSFSLPGFPGQGVFVALILLCRFYGRGLEEGFLLLKPVLPLLISSATLIDIATIGLINLLIGKTMRTQKEIALREYI